jgi:hypothetical protein
MCISPETDTSDEAVVAYFKGVLMFKGLYHTYELMNHISELVGTCLCKILFSPVKNLGTAVTQWLRCYATNRKVAGSNPRWCQWIFH